MTKKENKKIFIYESFGETLFFAEWLGFQDNEKEGDDVIVDGLEAEAISFIEEKGYKIRR